MSSRLLLGTFLALIAPSAAGCLGDQEERSPLTTGPLVPAPRLERPELTAFRTAGAETVRYDLVSSAANGKDVRVLVAGSERERMRPALFERAAWSPDGKRLAFTAESGTLGGFKADIYVVRASGSGLRRLTADRRSIHPLWSPDGRRIFFARRPKGVVEPRSESDARRLATAAIWSMRPDGSDRRRITPVVNGRSDLPGSFSPDGARLVFSRETFGEIDEEGRAPNTANVWVMRPDGSDARMLAKRSADPSFSPDARRIAFVSDRDENGELNYGDRVFFANELYVMEADGSDARRLTRTRALNERQPSWLPSGARIAYQRGKAFDNAEGTVVMQVNADGTCARPILADPRLGTWHAAPAWRPGDARTRDRTLRC